MSSNPTVPNFSDSLQWMTAYLTAHMLSVNSRRCTYILWFCVGFIFLVFSILHWTRIRGGMLHAYWSKWAIRRRTWRGQYHIQLAKRLGSKPQQISLPPNGQMLCLVILSIVTLLLAFVGPDYISPNVGLFDIVSRAYDTSDYVQYQPTYTIEKAWWTSGGRTGLIVFSLFPLCVLFALKSPPFAIFALPFTTQTHHDKLAWLHRWTSRIIWFLTALHVVLWSIQLVLDTRPTTGKSAYTYAFLYEKFIFGWIAFGLMTLLNLASIRPIRRSHYESFYYLHIILVPLTLIMSALHHPPVWQWCWAALGLWLCERVWRFTWWLHTNGFFGQEKTMIAPKVTPFLERQPHRTVDSEVNLLDPHIYPPSPYISSPTSATSLMSPVPTSGYVPPAGFAHAELLSGATVRLTLVTPGFLSWAPGQNFLINIPSVSRFLTHPFTVASVCDDQSSTESGRAIVFLVRTKEGWTKDLWDHIVKLVYSGQRISPGERVPDDAMLPPNGVLLNMYIDGPFGSSIRARWEEHSSIVIFVAGSGVSFGISILEYICLCLAGRDGKHLGGRAGGWGKKGFANRRVRFVWMIREYSHLQWCASTLARCMALIPMPGLEVNIFVTNFKPRMMKRVPPPKIDDLVEEGDVELAPPHPEYMGEKNRQSRSSSSTESSDDEEAFSDTDSVVDLSYYTGEFGDEMGDISNLRPDQLPNRTLELTNFDGDRDTTLPGEDALSRRVKKVGKLRRKQSVDATKALRSRVDSHFDTNQRQSHQSQPSRDSFLSTDALLPYDRDSVDMGLMPMTIRRVSISTDNLLHPSDATLGSPTSGKFPTSPLSPALDTASIRISPINTNLSTPGFNIIQGDYQQPQLHIAEAELRDMSRVAEHVRPGRPKLDRILQDEVETARGSIIVACCGPTSFNAMVRKVIAQEISPARIRRGDKRGYIDLVSEDYAF